jgi:hypothetical protein
MGYREAGAVIRPEQIHLERLPLSVGIALFDGSGIEADTGVDDEDIDAARSLVASSARLTEPASVTSPGIAKARPQPAEMLRAMPFSMAYQHS